MADERKSVLLRIPAELAERINRLAQTELRSTNAQIEFLLREALARRSGAGAAESRTESPARGRTSDHPGHAR